MPFQRLSPAAVLPARAHPGDAGLDLVAVEDLILGPGERAAVPTGWAVAIPEGMAGLVVPRSGNALRHGLTVANAPGVIDAGYRGELRVILVNLGAEPFAIAAGDRIAQLVVTPASLAFAAEVVALPASDGRGQAGLGSTGRGGPGRGIPLA
ncbi:MAG: dUTP diphosphatase [Actinobacteria bacterium]|nr:dUTP diphosphatase [Actinomycetota bacterium]